MAYKKGDVFPPQFEDVNGNPLVLGTIEFYQWNTTTPQPIAFDADGNTTATSVTLDLYGRPSSGGDPVDLFYNDALTYKIIRKDAAGTEISPVLGPYSPPIAGSDFLTDDDPDLGAGLLPYDQSLAYAAGSVGARLLRQLSAKDEPFNAVGDGVTDDTIAIQAFLTACAGKIGVIPPGTYLCNALTIYSNTKLSLHGATIKAISSLDSSDPVILNSAFDGTDTGIEFYGGTIQGNANDGNNALVAMLRVSRFKMVGTRLTGNKGQLLQLGGCQYATIDDVELDNYGRSAVTADGGCALYIGNYGDFPCLYTTIIAPKIHHGEWSAIYVAGTSGHICNRTQILSPKIFSVKEAAIFGVYFDRLLIDCPDISSVTIKNISANGIELGEGTYLDLNGGIISDVDASTITLSNIQAFNIHGVTSHNARRNAASFPTAGHLTFIQNTQQIWGSIINNTFLDTASPSQCAIDIGSTGSANQFITIRDNNCSGTAWVAGDPIRIAASKWGSGCVRRNNSSSIDMDNAADADNGDASVTLTVGYDADVQRFATTLTANRTVTLDTTAVYNGARFRIVRTGLGAFTLDVGGLKTIASGTAAYVDVIHDGVTWRLAGYGAL